VTLRGNCAYITELCRRAVQELYQASGASVIMRDVPFQRFYLDIQGLSQHTAMALNSNLEVHRRVEVGLDPGTPFIRASPACRPEPTLHGAASAGRVGPLRNVAVARAEYG
jgi:hypothetical protein